MSSTREKPSDEGAPAQAAAGNKSAKTRRKRRKDERPGEIVAAAMACFVKDGFAATRLEDVAREAGIAKGTIFRYFSSKEELFQAVARRVMDEDLNEIHIAAEAGDAPFEVLLPAFLKMLAERSTRSRVPAFSRLIMEEARLFPEVAAAWHQEVSGKAVMALSQIIARAQARGEVRPGDPRLFALSITAPLHTALLYGEVFGKAGPAAHFDIQPLAHQHAQTLLQGMMLAEGSARGESVDE